MVDHLASLLNILASINSNLKAQTALLLHSLIHSSQPFLFFCVDEARTNSWVYTVKHRFP